MLALLNPVAILDRQRGHLFPWVAVLYACGVGCFFALPSDPAPALWVGYVVAVLGAGALSLRCGAVWRPYVLVVLVPLLGLGAAALRTEYVAETKLSFRYYGPIEGRVVAIDRSQSDAMRLTLDSVTLHNTVPDRTPEKVRISLHGGFDIPRPEPGAIVGITGHIAPPGGPVEPGGYDFQRHAWFKKIGGVGYTRNPVLTLLPPEPGLTLAVLKTRIRIADRVREVLGNDVGGFAAAITTGDRSTLDRRTLDALRDTNMAHLLAISGLHMGLLTGFVFAAIRVAGAAIAPVSLRMPIKKFAVLSALVAGGIYLMLSGNAVATERAYIMAVVMFGAVMVDRRAVTLRAVAIAALIVLTCRPETLFGPGFQMSFAATTALVAVFSVFRDRGVSMRRGVWPLKLLGGVALSSAVAGLATAPIAAVHFNQVPHFGLLANLLSVPLMGLIVMPGAVASALLSCVGAEGLGLLIMKWPILWILAVAEEIASWDGAVSHVVTPSWPVLPLLGLGGMIAALAVGRARLAAIPVLGLAFLLWATAERPTVLISESGGQVAFLNDEGLRVPSRRRGDGFAVRSWLENDGDPVDQAVAAARNGWSKVDTYFVAKLGGFTLAHGTGVEGSRAALEQCGRAIVIVNRDVPPQPKCQFYGPRTLAESGSLSIYMEDGHVRVIPTHRSGVGRRWSQ